MFKMHRDYSNIMHYKHVKICYNMINIFEHERKKVATFIQNILEAFRVPSIAYGNNYDIVDPNLVRYFRTEYGRDRQSELNQHLDKINKNK